MKNIKKTKIIIILSAILITGILLANLFPFRAMAVNDFVITSGTSQIKSGETFKATIQNNSLLDAKYEVKINDLQTGSFVTKNSGVVKAKNSISILTPITDTGSHTAEVDMTDSTGKNTLYTQKFNVVVVAATSGSSSQPMTNSDGAKTNITLGGIFKSIFTGNDPTTADLGSINKLILVVINYALNFAGIVAFVMVLWAARSFLNAYGSDEAAAMGKKTLIWAFVGLAVILVSKGLLNWMVCWFTTTGTCK